MYPFKSKRIFHFIFCNIFVRLTVQVNLISIIRVLFHILSLICRLWFPKLMFTYNLKTYVLVCLREYVFFKCNLICLLLFGFHKLLLKTYIYTDSDYIMKINLIIFNIHNCWSSKQFFYFWYNVRLRVFWNSAVKKPIKLYLMIVKRLVDFTKMRARFIQMKN
jgi:hypothetical protein